MLDIRKIIPHFVGKDENGVVFEIRVLVQSETYLYGFFTKGNESYLCHIELTSTRLSFIVLPKQSTAMFGKENEMPEWQLQGQQYAYNFKGNFSQNHTEFYGVYYPTNEVALNSQGKKTCTIKKVSDEIVVFDKY